jgi:hypothetical protein
MTYIGHNKQILQHWLFWVSLDNQSDNFKYWAAEIQRQKWSLCPFRALLLMSQ